MNAKTAFVGRNGRRYSARASHDYAGLAAKFIKADAEIHSFEEAAAFLGGETSKRLASNVQVVALNATSIAIRLYETDIIVYHRDGMFSFSNGGYATPTTSSRCCQFGPRGYYFSHRNRILHANGTPEREGQRLPTMRKEPS